MPMGFMTVALAALTVPSLWAVYRWWPGSKLWRCLAAVPAAGVACTLGIIALWPPFHPLTFLLPFAFLAFMGWGAVLLRRLTGWSEGCKPS